MLAGLSLERAADPDGFVDAFRGDDQLVASYLSDELLDAMSQRAANSLTADQREIIERSCRIVAVDVPTVELSGGSVRCMIAGIHLSPRKD